MHSTLPLTEFSNPMITNVGILRANPSRLFDNTENLFFEEEEEKKGGKGRK